MLNKALNVDNLSSFLNGRLEGAGIGSPPDWEVITLLKLLGAVDLYFRPGYHINHSDMLDELQKTGDRVGYAGRLVRKGITGFPLSLEDGGKSIRGYAEKERGVVVSIINGLLGLLDDARVVM